MHLLANHSHANNHRDLRFKSQTFKAVVDSSSNEDPQQLQNTKFLVKTETQINEGTMIHARDNTHNPRSVKLLLEISVSVFLPVCVCEREGNRWCFIQREHQGGIEIYKFARFDHNHAEFRFRSKILRNSKSERSYWSKATQEVYIIS